MNRLKCLITYCGVFIMTGETLDKIKRGLKEAGGGVKGGVEDIAGGVKDTAEEVVEPNTYTGSEGESEKRL